MLVNFSSAENRPHVDGGILDYLNNFYSNSCQSLLFLMRSHAPKSHTRCSCERSIGGLAVRRQNLGFQPGGVRLDDCLLLKLFTFE